jgi:hypothetical protein
MLDAEDPQDIEPEAHASDRDSIPWHWKLQKVEVPDHALMFVGRHFEDRCADHLLGSPFMCPAVPDEGAAAIADRRSIGITLL